MMRMQRRIFNTLRPLSLLLIVSASLTSLEAAVPSHAQQPGMATVTPEQRTAALTGAKSVVRKMSQAKSLKDFANILSNRSAGATGVMMTGIVGMAIGFGDTPGAKSPSGMPHAQMKSEYDALIKHWGLSKSGPGMAPGSSPSALPPAVAQNGRGFLSDIATFMNKIGPDSHSMGAQDAISEHNVVYTVLSPARVRLTMKPKPGQHPTPPVEAVKEDGQWRIDMGDINTMMAHQGSAIPAHPTTP